MMKNPSMTVPFENKIYLSSPTMHGDEIKYIQEAYETNWMSTVGKNIEEAERLICDLIGRKHSVALSSGTAALHLAIRLAGERLYGKTSAVEGTLRGHKVFASDMTFCATVNPISYEGGEIVFIDSEPESWNMDPVALEKAFELFPEVRLVVVAHLYGTPAKITDIRKICDSHNAILIEDAAESLGATFEGKQTGVFGDYSIISFNGNKIITGSSGGMLLCDDDKEAEKVRKWSTQSRDDAPWYQHTELGYNYRMSNVIAGVVRGQIPHLGEHILQKKEIYNRYKKAFERMPLKLNPFDGDICKPNYWLSCVLIEKNAMCNQVRDDYEASFEPEKGKSCPTEILKAISTLNAEGRPIWKPMHMQPIYKTNSFITKDGEYLSKGCNGDGIAVSEDIFERGLCLPSDNKMTIEQQNRIIDIISECFE